MRREICLSETTTFVSLASIASNVAGIEHETIDPLPYKTCVFANNGKQIDISYRNEQITFAKKMVTRFDIVPITHSGEMFYAATIEFIGENEALRYGIIVVSESELDWLRALTSELGNLLECPLIDCTRRPQTLD